MARITCYPPSPPIPMQEFNEDRAVPVKAPPPCPRQLPLRMPRLKPPPAPGRDGGAPAPSPAPPADAPAPAENPGGILGWALDMAGDAPGSEQERHERLSRVMDEHELWWTTGRKGISPSGFSWPGWLVPHKLQIMEDLLSRVRPQPTDITRQDAPLEEEPAPGDERVPGDAVTEDF